MSTGIESWTPVKEITTLSPFAGSEVLFTIIAVVVWIGWHVWQIKHENATLADEAANYGNEENSTSAINSE